MECVASRGWEGARRAGRVHLHLHHLRRRSCSASHGEPWLPRRAEAANAMGSAPLGSMQCRVPCRARMPKSHLDLTSALEGDAYHYVWDSKPASDAQCGWARWDGSQAARWAGGERARRVWRMEDREAGRRRGCRWLSVGGRRRVCLHDTRRAGRRAAAGRGGRTR
jgi:hypothetical protein